jgi:hypothetical protein
MSHSTTGITTQSANRVRRVVDRRALIAVLMVSLTPVDGSLTVTDPKFDRGSLIDGQGSVLDYPNTD